MVDRAQATDGESAFGDRLRRWRVEAGLTQQQLAELAGLSARTVSDLERGVRRYPYHDTRQRLADAMQLDDAQRAAVHAGARLSTLRLAPAPESIAIPQLQLPAELSSFIGRESELGVLDDLLTTTRLLTLRGPGGIGKTRLALRLARAYAERTSASVVVAELGSIADASRVPRAVLGAVGLPEQSSRSIDAILTDHFASRQALLVLDSCEHLLEECASLADALLRGAPGLRVLTTTREALNVSGESVWSVPPLGLPTDTLQSIRQSDAIRLFTERTRAHLAGFTLTDANAADVLDICVRLDGIPLALELAASRVARLGLHWVTAHLEDTVVVLTGGNRTAPERQRTLRATIDWSYVLLTEQERLLFNRLSVFAGGWTLHSAESTCAGNGISATEIADLLSRLVEQSLVMADMGHDSFSPRFHLLDTLRQFASEQLRRDEHRQAIHRQHALTFLALAEEALPSLAGPTLESTQQRLIRENDNLRAALRWLLDHDEVEAAQRLGAVLGHFWMYGSQFAEGREWLAELLRASPIASQPRSVRRKLLTSAGLLASFQGDHVAARTALEESLALTPEGETSADIAQVLLRLGELAWWRGDYTAARALLDRGLVASRATGVRPVESMCLFLLASTALDTNDLARASALAEESLAVAVAFSHRIGIAMARLVLGRLAYHRRVFDEARMHFEEAAELFRALGFPWGVARARSHLGWVALDEGDAHAGQLLFEESLRLAHLVNAANRVLSSLEGFGQLAAQSGDSIRAVRLFGAADGLRESSGAAIGAPDWARFQSRLAGAMATLPVHESEAAYQAGRRLSLDNAVREALRQEVLQ
jgi:predicted ATPase/DNA-binding XRE family transcriptional regulator